jgi:hypothetical protein
MLLSGFVYFEFQGEHIVGPGLGNSYKLGSSYKLGRICKLDRSYKFGRSHKLGIARKPRKSSIPKRIKLQTSRSLPKRIKLQTTPLHRPSPPFLKGVNIPHRDPLLPRTPSVYSCCPKTRPHFLDTDLELALLFLLLSVVRIVL